MKNISIWWLFAGALLLTGCYPSEKRTDAGQAEKVVETATRSTEFVPHPQDVPKQEVKRLPIGGEAPDFRLPGIDGRFYSLDDFRDAKVLVIIFTCNHCPTAQAYEDRIIRLVDDYKNKGVEVVAISPNSVLGILPEELGYTDLNDSYEEMKIRAKDKGFNFKYLYDGDTQKASLRYGPSATPHAFLFDHERKLRYTGRLDDSEKPGTAHADDLRNAIDAVLLGKEIKEPITKNFGCSIKWAWKREYAEKADRDWAKKPVKLADLSDKEAKALIQNHSKKLRLVNFWATWCGPCVVEYPDLVTLQRMYGARDFEFVSVSLDKKEKREQVVRFLEEKHSAVQNYIFAGENVYQLIEVVDHGWDGTIPFTLLIEPDGKIAYREVGAVDILSIKKAIVDNPLMGRYY